MKASNRPSTPIASFAALAAALALSSCSLPPREAWHQIQRDGLIAFLANEARVSAPATAPRPAPIPAEVPTPTKTAIAAHSSQYVGPPGPAASVNPAPAPPVTASRNLMPAHDKALMASSVPSLPGFVRSPYTIPPRLVDVKGAAPGASMICPYTQRAFIIPSDFVNPPGAAIASTTPPSSKPLSQPPTIALKNNIPTGPPASTNPPANALFSNKPAGNTSPAASTAAAKSATPEIPYGMPIPNRPGFVNSPFAAKHQLVDVTGLPVGMEVKCPYTGKLFKVPASDIAEQKAVASPGAPPAPEAAEKK